MQENGGSSIAQTAGKLQQVLPSLAKKGPLSEGDMWLLQGLCEGASHVPGCAGTGVGTRINSGISPLAPLGVPARGLQGQAQVHAL